MNVTLAYDAPGNDSYNATNGLDCGGEPHQYAIWEKSLIVMIAIVLSSTTVIGNIMVMISFKIDKQLQTISNYFLFSLAVADFAIGLISMPLFTVYTVLGYWPLGPHVCDTWLALDYLASNASVLNLLIISFDRYFSVTRPLTYRAKRTTCKAATMIGCAWGISLLLWPPWIYAWPYIEGQRTVPINACYIQFIETNHYITFGTAIAAFYVPVTVMIILYWRIWKETEKRKKDLPGLIGDRDKQETSKRSNSSEEALDMDDCKRPRSESSTGADEINVMNLPTSYMERHYPQYKGEYRPFSWTWLKMWCIAWWHSGRDDDDEDEDVGAFESTHTVQRYEETLTPISAETPLPSTVSRGASISEMHSCIERHDDRRQAARPTGFSTRSPSTDSIYTIMIRLPGKESNGAGRFNESTSIRMYHEDVALQLHARVHEENGDDDIGRISRFDGSTIASPSSIIRRPSQITDMRMPLAGRNMPRTLQTSTTAGKGVLVKPPPNKKKKKIQEKKADRKAAKTLSAILLAFIITWTPYNILVLLKSITACSWYIPQKLWDFFYYLCYINSTVNPMCYALCNAAFRRTYVRILKCKWHSRNRTAVDRG